MLTDDEIADYQRKGESQTEDLGLEFFRKLCAQAREANALRAQLADRCNQVAEYAVALDAVEGQLVGARADCTRLRQTIESMERGGRSEADWYNGGGR